VYERDDAPSGVSVSPAVAFSRCFFMEDWCKQVSTLYLMFTVLYILIDTFSTYNEHGEGHCLNGSMTSGAPTHLDGPFF